MSDLKLPIFDVLPELLGALENHNRAILQAPPGAGKSTQVPLALLRAPWVGNGRILMLEPRRLAASHLARFMAFQLGEPVGATVGYRTRTESRVGADTRIEVVTEGILVRMLQSDPLLEAYAALLFDEVHERSLQSDMALALALDCQQSLREDLRILLMSATLSGHSLQTMLGQPPLIQSEGRAYPVELVYRPLSVHKPWLGQVASQIRKVLDERTGSVLAFLPGVGEIRRLVELLAEGLPNDVQVAPLYGALSPEAQRQAIEPCAQGYRKVVLATSIAETSLTIEGVSVVVDTGLGRAPQFDVASGMSRLETIKISKSAATQRAGRAGRLGPGVCYRLWSEEQHQRRSEQEVPEILCSDLTALALELAAWGVKEVSELSWQDLPPATHLDAARQLLRQLEALDEQGRVTAHGQRLIDLGVHPRLAHMLICAEQAENSDAGCRGLLGTACDLAALLGERDILTGEARHQADLALRMRLIAGTKPSAPGVNRAALKRVRQQAAKLARRLHITGRHGASAQEAASPNIEALGTLLAWAYPERIAQQRQSGSERYLLSSGKGAVLAADDPLVGTSYLVAASLAAGRNRAEARIELAVPIAQSSLEALMAGRIYDQEQIGWDPRRRQPVAERRRCLGALVLARSPLQALSSEQRTQAFLEGIRAEGLQVLPWTQDLERWRLRVQCARQWLNESGGEHDRWPDLSDQQLLADLEQWLAPFLISINRWDQLKQVDLTGALHTLLGWCLSQRLDELLPTHYQAPSGSRIRITYDLAQPKLSVRLQEMFGETRTPSVAGGQVPLLVELLSPAGRPVQLTQNLEAFWNGSYQQVRKEMKGRYPKHPWPEDPWSALPTRGTKRHQGAHPGGQSRS